MIYFCKKKKREGENYIGRRLRFLIELRGEGRDLESDNGVVGNKNNMLDGALAHFRLKRGVKVYMYVYIYIRECMFVMTSLSLIMTYAA